jgi:hypothetical protein
MIRIFLFILFFIISNKSIASLKGKTLICDINTMGYNFISKDKVKISNINKDNLNIVS